MGRGSGALKGLRFKANAEYHGHVYQGVIYPGVPGTKYYNLGFTRVYLEYTYTLADYRYSTYYVTLLLYDAAH